MQTETAQPETFTGVVGISIERTEEIKNTLAAAVKEFFDKDEYETKADALKLAVDYCKPQTVIEGVVIGMALQAALDNYSNPLQRLLNALSE